MKKNGFTLIELLAVIVILAIIALITVPVVLSAIGTARAGAAKESARNFVSAVEFSCAQELLDSTKTTVIDGKTASGGNYTLDRTAMVKADSKGTLPDADVAGKTNSLTVSDTSCKLTGGTVYFNGTAFVYGTDF